LQDLIYKKKKIPEDIIGAVTIQVLFITIILTYYKNISILNIKILNLYTGINL